MTEYEYRTLRLLHRLGTLPSPQPIDFFSIEECNVIVMSNMPGREFGRVAHRMSSEDRVRLLLDVKGYMDRTNRAMVSFGETHTVDAGAVAVAPRAISDLDGRRCFRFPLLDGFVDGSVDLSTFVETMSSATPQPTDMIQLQQSVLQTLLQPHASDAVADREHDIRFCHMDLHPDNILVHRG